MAGMGDNPLVGDYTKGISKGGKYFHDLRARIIREKAPARAVFRDLQFGLFQEMDRMFALAEKANGLDRKPVKSDPKSVSKQIPVGNFNDKTVNNSPRWRVATRKDLALLKQQLSRACG